MRISDWSSDVCSSDLYAARGGLDRAAYAWGSVLAPEGVMMANYWQGLFPSQNLLTDGYERTSPVRTYPPNGLGLYAMIANVWEWTADWYSEAATGHIAPSCRSEERRGGKEGVRTGRVGGWPDH